MKVDWGWELLLLVRMHQPFKAILSIIAGLLSSCIQALNISADVLLRTAAALELLPIL